MVRSACLFVLLAVSSSLTADAVQAQERYQGLARLIDGDTIVIQHEDIRLNGIDTPEPGQRCRDGRNREYACGKHATDALNRLIRGRPVVCMGTERDDYDRLIAECRIGEMSLNRELVRLGWAVAYREYSDKYLAEELEAQKANRGIWRGAIPQLPHEFRALRWKVAEQASPEGCPIKGNINREGVRIYHTPWSQYYTRTKISLEKGERWFCNENEAKLAGWRPPLR